jgi:hypothetical protein
MSFTWRLCLLLALMAICGTGLSMANRSPVVELQKPDSSPYYISDGQIITVPPGFSLQREAAAMKAYQSDLEAAQAVRNRY